MSKSNWNIQNIPDQSNKTIIINKTDRSQQDVRTFVRRRLMVDCERRYRRAGAV